MVDFRTCIDRNTPIHGLRTLSDEINWCIGMSIPSFSTYSYQLKAWWEARIWELALFLASQIMASFGNARTAPSSDKHWKVGPRNTAQWMDHTILVFILTSHGSTKALAHRHVLEPNSKLSLILDLSNPEAVNGWIWLAVVVEQEVKSTVCGYYANVSDSYSILSTYYQKTFCRRRDVEGITCPMR